MWLDRIITSDYFIVIVIFSLFSALICFTYLSQWYLKKYIYRE